VKVATGPEHYKSVSEVAAASEELKNGNGPGMLKHLKQAGSWVLENAKDLGAKVIVQLIQSKM
jgi:hypothetical protein